MAQRRMTHTVKLQFLRAGPAHKQLLSPSTWSLAICREAGATVLHVPWEHAPFERRLEGLRYEHGTDEDPARRRAFRFRGTTGLSSRRTRRSP